MPTAALYPSLKLAPPPPHLANLRTQRETSITFPPAAVPITVKRDDMAGQEKRLGERKSAPIV